MKRILITMMMLSLIVLGGCAFKDGCLGGIAKNHCEDNNMTFSGYTLPDGMLNEGGFWCIKEDRSKTDKLHYSAEEVLDCRA